MATLDRVLGDSSFSCPGNMGWGRRWDWGKQIREGTHVMGMKIPGLNENIGIGGGD